MVGFLECHADWISVSELCDQWIIVGKCTVLTFCDVTVLPRLDQWLAGPVVNIFCITMYRLKSNCIVIYWTWS